MARPAPVLTEDNAFFWEAAAQGRLVAQRCRQCGRLRHPPRPMCPTCRALDPEVVDLAGTGAVYSYAALHHPQHPQFDYPVLAALVDVDEGIRLVTNLIGVDIDRVQIGLRVRVAFVVTDGDMAVPVFEPDRPGGGVEFSRMQHLA